MGLNPAVSGLLGAGCLLLCAVCPGVEAPYSLEFARKSSFTNLCCGPGPWFWGQRRAMCSARQALSSSSCQPREAGLAQPVPSCPYKVVDVRWRSGGPCPLGELTISGEAGSFASACIKKHGLKVCFVHPWRSFWIHIILRIDQVSQKSTLIVTSLHFSDQKPPVSPHCLQKEVQMPLSGIAGSLHCKTNVPLQSSGHLFQLNHFICYSSLLSATLTGNKPCKTYFIH